MIKVKRLEELEENKMEKEKIALEGDWFCTYDLCFPK